MYSPDGCSLIQFAARALKFLGDELFVWKDSLILGGEHLIGEIVECVVGFRSSFFGAQDESDWRVFAGLHPVLAGVVQVKVHLSSVRVTEFAYLQINYDQAAQAAVKEDKVDTKPCFVDAKPALAAKEGKVIAQLQEKVGEMPDECILQV